MSAFEPDPSRLVFVGGLHRSGTTPFVRWLAQHPDVSGFSGTNVWEDEGQHLQSVYPGALEYRGPGRFAFDPKARLTEESPLVSDESRRRLMREWSPWWNPEAAVLVEKSPPNLIRMRFLAALFEGAHFVVVVRHPVATAYATQKWTRTPILSLVRHWLIAHELSLADAERVPNVTMVRYEDLMAHPDRVMMAVFDALGLAPFTGEWSVKPGLNEAYLRRWGSGMKLFKGPRAAIMARRYESRVLPFGYSLAEPYVLDDLAPAVRRLAVPQLGARA